jgi:hypothetical protein
MGRRLTRSSGSTWQLWLSRPSGGFRSLRAGGDGITFVRRGGRIYHSYSTELAFVPGQAGQNQRHIDMMWPLWNLLVAARLSYAG